MRMLREARCDRGDGSAAPPAAWRMLDLLTQSSSILARDLPGSSGYARRLDEALPARPGYRDGAPRLRAWRRFPRRAGTDGPIGQPVAPSAAGHATAADRAEGSIDV